MSPEKSLLTASHHPHLYPLPSPPVNAWPTFPSPAPSDESAGLPRRAVSASSVSQQAHPAGISSPRTPLDPSLSFGAWTQPLSVSNIQPQSGPGFVLPGSAHRQHYPHVAEQHVLPSHANYPPQSADTISQAAFMHPRTSSKYSIPFDREKIKLSVDNMAIQHHIQARNEPSYLAGRGRLSLLKEAIEQDDMFYLVLSQLICARSINANCCTCSVREYTAVMLRFA
nr:hypothetical protein CFP56_57890 [Quercus suber]